MIAVYIAEAHFVERDSVTGDIVDGWPIGFYEYEYRQHKVIEDRRNMARLASKEMTCLKVRSNHNNNSSNDLFDFRL